MLILSALLVAFTVCQASILTSFDSSATPVPVTKQGFSEFLAGLSKVPFSTTDSVNILLCVGVSKASSSPFTAASPAAPAFNDNNHVSVPALGRSLPLDLSNFETNAGLVRVFANALRGFLKLPPARFQDIRVEALKPSLRLPVSPSSFSSPNSAAEIKVSLSRDSQGFENELQMIQNVLQSATAASLNVFVLDSFLESSKDERLANQARLASLLAQVCKRPHLLGA